jgi:hypothetical protein
MFTLSKSRLPAFAETLRDIAQIFFASVLIDPIISRTANWWMFCSGLILSFVFWTLGIYLIKD